MYCDKICSRSLPLSLMSLNTVREGKTKIKKTVHKVTQPIPAGHPADGEVRTPQRLALGQSSNGFRKQTIEFYYSVVPIIKGCLAETSSFLVSHKQNFNMNQKRSGRPWRVATTAGSGTQLQNAHLGSQSRDSLLWGRSANHPPPSISWAGIPMVGKLFLLTWGTQVCK